jgi:hypothetical protein
MRLLKVAFAALVTLIAMLFSLVVAVGVAAIGLAAYLYVRLRGKPVSVRFGGTAKSPAAKGVPPDAIDITATEVGSRHLDH